MCLSYSGWEAGLQEIDLQRAVRATTTALGSWVGVRTVCLMFIAATVNKVGI